MVARTLPPQHPDGILQTPLGESHPECFLNRSLYPEAQERIFNYVYYQLVDPMSNPGHCIHLSGFVPGVPAEIHRCPPVHRHRHRQRHRRADVRTLDDGSMVPRLQRQQMPVFQSFLRPTRGNAEALGPAAEIGTQATGSAAGQGGLPP